MDNVNIALRKTSIQISPDENVTAKLLKDPDKLNKIILNDHAD